MRSSCDFTVADALAISTASGRAALNPFARKIVGGGEAKGSVGDDANADAQRFGVGGAGDLAVLGGQRAIALVDNAGFGAVRRLAASPFPVPRKRFLSSAITLSRDDIVFWEARFVEVLHRRSARSSIVFPTAISLLHELSEVSTCNVGATIKTVILKEGMPSVRAGALRLHSEIRVAQQSGTQGAEAGARLRLERRRRRLALRLAIHPAADVTRERNPRLHLRRELAHQR